MTSSQYDTTRSAPSAVQKRQLGLLRRLAQGTACQRRGGKDLIAGEDVSQDIIALVALDLARRGPEGEVRISPPGRAFLRRQAAGGALAGARRRRDTAAATVLSPYRGQHQELEAVTEQ